MELSDVTWKAAEGATFTHVAVYDAAEYGRLRRLWRWVRRRDRLIAWWELKP